MGLKTAASIGACALAIAGCGGGQLAGQAPATTPAPTTPATTAQAPKPVRTAPVRTTPRPATTRTQPPATTHATPATTVPAQTTPTGPATHVVDEQASVTLVRTIGQLHYIQRGHVSGTFDGDMTLETKPGSRGGIVTFTLDVAGGGTVSGRGVVTPNLSAGGTLKPITGTAVITSGTGPFAGISGHRLIVTGKAALDGSQGFVRLTGVVRY